MRPEYKAFVKEAKSLGIKTHDELYNLCLEDRYQSISGAANKHKNVDINQEKRLF